MGYAAHIEKRSRPAPQRQVPAAVPSIMRHAATGDALRTGHDRSGYGQASPRFLAGSALQISQPGDAYEREADAVAERVMHGPGGAGRIMRKAGACPRFLAKSALAISEPGDAHEREAEAVAGRVMDGAGGGLPIMRKAASGGSCGSAPSQAPEEEEQEPIMRSPVSGRVQRQPDLAARLGASRTSGSPLPDGVRAFMESRIGADFRGVRVHTDSHAGRMTEDLSAAAFASGHDIYFRSGYYQPDAAEGRKLLAHELTHVAQQQAGRAAPSAGQTPILRYTLNGFPAAEESQMHTAVAAAKSTVGSCDYLTWIGKHDIKVALERSRYDYVPDLGLCGWTFPSSWYIEVGSTAFDSSQCCDLASTLAHEASHVMWRTEGGARKMECECFGCSC